jgi:hypothetical protein
MSADFSARCKNLVSEEKNALQKKMPIIRDFSLRILMRLADFRYFFLRIADLFRISLCGLRIFWVLLGKPPENPGFCKSTHGGA